MKLDDDDFTLFGLREGFALDARMLDQRWRELQAEVHPDRFAADGAAAQRIAMQWAVRVNQAYRRLKDPLQRAAYLCERRGAPIDAERNTAMPPVFLAQQMAWREALDEAERRGRGAGLGRRGGAARGCGAAAFADAARRAGQRGWQPRPRCVR